VFADVHDAVRRAVRVSETIAPVSAWVDAYAAGYERFRRLYPATKELT
jgi:hypothetical protein